jgi:hypothetical protein
MIDSFHWEGTNAEVSSVFIRCFKAILLGPDRFLSIPLWMRSIPTALLLDVGRHFSISSIVIGSFNTHGVFGVKLLVITSS